MLRKIMGGLIVSGLLFSSVYADGDSAKGQKWYLKYVKDMTHLKGNEFTAMKTGIEWKDMFKDNMSGLKTFVKEKFNNPKLDDFIASDKFKEKYAEDFMEFLINFSKDSGKVPSC